MLASQKHLFSIDPNIHYFNCAYKSPLLKSAEAAAVAALIQQRNPHEVSPSDFFKEMSIAKIEFGKLVNCDEAHVAVIPSVSYGFSSVLNNIFPKLKGNVVTLKGEFPSAVFTLQRWCKDHENSLCTVAPDDGLDQVGENWNDKILESINEQTTMVAMSTIHWMNGLKFDLEAIGEKCKKVGAFFILDGTQSVGALEIDVKKFNVDALICASYKWLFGPYSLGLAYISDAFSNGVPLEESWMNRTNAQNFSALAEYDQNYISGAGRFSVGETSNFILMSILIEGLKQINEWQPKNIQDYCRQLIIPLKDHLVEKNIIIEDAPYFSNHLFSMKLPNNMDLNILKQKFVENSIYISQRGESLRLSVNVFNDESDIEKIISVLE